MGNAESSPLRHDRHDRRTPRSPGDDSTFDESRVTEKTEDFSMMSGRNQRRTPHSTRSRWGDDSTFFSYGGASTTTNLTMTRDTSTEPRMNSSNNTHTTASTSSQSIADQSMAMMNKIVLGGTALCGSLGQVNDDDIDGDGDDDYGRRANRGMLSKAERYVNCNKNFAKSSPMEEEDYSARSQRRGGSFLGPENDSDDDMDDEDSYARRGRSYSHGHDLNNDSAAASTVSKLFSRAMAAEIVSKPRGMNTDKDESKVVNPDNMPAPEASAGVDTDRALRALKNFALNAGGDDEGSRGPSPANGGNLSAVPPVVRVGDTDAKRAGAHTITIGLSLSRKHSVVGHPDTITRQTAFDFNELQDRNYKYVSSTDPSGWLAGGGESPNGPMPDVTQSLDGGDDDDGPTSFGKNISLGKAEDDMPKKLSATDTVHIPILHIDCPNEKAVDQVIKSLANGELIIPHMSVLPESLSASGVSPPDLVVRFGCERNEDLPSDEWPNWSLEFMHNQLYEYFKPLGARWEPRPFEIVLARKVKWRTGKHMNKYFAHCERVIGEWRDNGPQYLFPQRNYLEGDGAASEEVTQPHGVYIWRGDNPAPSHYFPPNFEPPYNTNMKRALLSNVVNKSWDKKKRDWISEPVPHSITPAQLIGTMCGCTDDHRNRFSSLGSPTTQPHVPNGNDILFESNSLTFDQTGEYSEFESLRQAQREDQKATSSAATRSAAFNDTSGAGAVFGVNESSTTNANSISTIPFNVEDRNNGEVLDVSTEFSGTERASVMSKSSGIVDTRTPAAPTSNQIFFPPTDAFIEEYQQHQQQRDSSPVQDTDDVVQRTPNDGAKISPTESEKKKRSKRAKKEREQRKNQAIADIIQRQERESTTPKQTSASSIQSKAASSKTSVGESQTTVPINNKSKILETERKHRQQREIERREEQSKVALMEQKLQAKHEDEQRKRLIKEAQEETRKARALISRSSEENNIDDAVVPKSPSGETLEYSVDSSSILREKGNGSNKFGGSDFSTSTTGSSLLPLDNTVPTDEELFAFGWAKALDPNTKAYYCTYLRVLFFSIASPIYSISQYLLCRISSLQSFNRFHPGQNPNCVDQPSDEQRPRSAINVESREA